MIYLQDETQVEEYGNYFVKREDTACLPPGPPFAKVRGLYRRLQTLKKDGVEVIGYYDTAISMATYGTSYFCKHLNMKSVVFRYLYSGGLVHNQALQDIIWKKYGAEVHIIEGGNMQNVQALRAKNMFSKMYPDGVFFKPGLKFDETIEEVSKQVELLPESVLGGTIVICTGSGWMCAGVISGLLKKDIEQKVVGVMVSNEKSAINLKKKILDETNWFPYTYKVDFDLVDAGYEYKQTETCNVPFPCCRYYDRKAYKWMIDNLQTLKQPVLFWNIGGDYRIS